MTEFKDMITSYFGELTDDEFNKMMSYFHLEKISKNEFFTEEGKHCNRFSFQKTGILRVFKMDDGKEVTQWISTLNYFITDVSSFFFGEPSRWSIQALSDSELLTISNENYKQLCEAFPKWNEIEKRFLAKCFAMLEDRVYSHLTKSAEERYTLYFEQNKSLFNQVPLQYLASVLGMSAETFSRIRKRQLENS
ncbi:MAG: Crp/Fnr family transcriptional regulator [Crocinitomicaceae bacterium]|nr:Crp/Fnr family transcriptional regulator [Crocinitomicaceae bacterium]